LDDFWNSFICTSIIYIGYFMTKIFKGYLFIIGLISIIMGLWAMLSPNFITWYPGFESIERGTPAASFVRTMSGVFVASGYILIRFIFSSSKVQLGTVLVYLCIFMLVGKLCGFLYEGSLDEGLLRRDLIVFGLGVFTLIGLYIVHKHRKNLLNYDI